MAKIGTAAFPGASGTQYSFNVYTIDSNFNNVGALYVFSNRIITGGKGSHDLLYIGETGELAKRLTDHEKWPCAERNSVNCICIHVESNKQIRLDIETDLIRNYNTACNEQ